MGLTFISRLVFSMNTRLLYSVKSSSQSEEEVHKAVFIHWGHGWTTAGHILNGFFCARLDLIVSLAPGRSDLILQFSVLMEATEGLDKQIQIFFINTLDCCLLSSLPTRLKTFGRTVLNIFV